MISLWSKGLSRVFSSATIGSMVGHSSSRKMRSQTQPMLLEPCFERFLLTQTDQSFTVIFFLILKRGITLESQSSSTTLYTIKRVSTWVLHSVEKRQTSIPIRARLCQLGLRLNTWVSGCRHLTDVYVG